MNRTIRALCLAGLIATVIGGCGSDSNSASGGSTQEAADSEAPGIAVISAKRIPDFAEVLVNSRGRTLYVFQNDKHTANGPSSACYGACAEDWPPLLTEGEPKGENGAFPWELDTFERKDGSLQVTYHDHPLYTYIGDKGTGDRNGYGVTAFGGEWYAIRPNGKKY